ncbi:hypothetical protein [Glycomyces tenuis]|uniref:hypothetical protein n=1 Tax=Glycomyces tenuis TaxID=58116 RepID=UPI0012DC4373|nr:hypothetical protein [Glycomyces tenuis]
MVNPEDPELESSPGMWVVTDLRLRYLEFIPHLPERIRAEAVARTGYDHLPSEPVQPATRLEVSSSELQHTAGITRQFGRRFKTREAAYDRFTFADGSGIDLRVDALEPINAL